MEFVCYSAWDQLPESANKLFKQAENKSIFYSRPWFENLTDNTLDDGQSMLLACVVNQHEALAILPLLKSDGENWQSLIHKYTTHYSLLLAESDQENILKCLVQGLSKLPVHSFRLAPVADNDSNLQHLQQVMESSGFSCQHYFRFYNWIHRVKGQSFDEYMSERPSRVRNTVKRKQRKLEREHKSHIKLFTGDDWDQGLADYTTVYNASWKVREQFADLLKGIVEKSANEGWLRLAVLYIDNIPVAAQFWTVVANKASIFRLAYDDKWKQYSPGSILISYLMKYVIDTDKVEEIDFLYGNDAYKQEWMSDRRERFELSCVNTNFSKNKQNFLSTINRWYRNFIN